MNFTVTFHQFSFPLMKIPQLSIIWLIHVIVSRDIFEFFQSRIIFSVTRLPYRTKLDLGIVKKSIAVDDVSKSSFQFSYNLYDNLYQSLDCKCVRPSPQWFTLKDTPTGRVHLQLEWLALLPTTDRLEQVRLTRCQRYMTFTPWCIICVSFSRFRSLRYNQCENIFFFPILHFRSLKGTRV